MCPADRSAPPRDSLDSEDVVSPDATTPPGGFMARPGLKRPPQHAVVVRVGDAPVSEHIPLARTSVPPPPPVSAVSASAALHELLLTAPPVGEPAPDSERDKLTLRVASSLPPPSEMPVVASVRAPASFAASRARSRWTVLLAAAAGLLIGLASVATRMRSGGEAPAGVASLSLEPAPMGLTRGSSPLPAPSARELPSASARTQTAPVPATSAEEIAPQPKAWPSGRPPNEAPRRSIF